MGRVAVGFQYEWVRREAFAGVFPPTVARMASHLVPRGRSIPTTRRSSPRCAGIRSELAADTRRVRGGLSRPSFVSS
jgi:hypothetical protein